MLTQMARPKDDPNLASPAEVARALGRLSTADQRRLELIARSRADGLASTDWADLLQEGIARALEGTRRWPRSVPIVAFLAQTMRSIASDQRRRSIEGSIEREFATDAVGDDLHMRAEISDQLRRIESRFAEDPNVLALMEGLQFGESARETQVRVAMSPAAYDAARKRFWRGVGELSGESK